MSVEVTQARAENPNTPGQGIQEITGLDIAPVALEVTDKALQKFEQLVSGLARSQNYFLDASPNSVYHTTERLAAVLFDGEEVMVVAPKLQVRSAKTLQRSTVTQLQARDLSLEGMRLKAIKALRDQGILSYHRAITLSGGKDPDDAMDAHQASWDRFLAGVSRFGKADAKKQERFLAAYQKLKATMKQEDHLYFADATHPQHNTKPSYGWVFKGKAHDKLVKTTSGRQRLNLHGALNLKTHHAVVLSEDTIDAASVIRLGNRLVTKHKIGKIYVILDNAKYYHAKIVKTWRNKHGRIKFIFLPSYSPNLNLIERLWRFFHQKVTWNRYFETFGEFKNTSLGFFKNLKQYDRELATLLTDNFQVIPSQKLQT